MFSLLLQLCLWKVHLNNFYYTSYGRVSTRPLLSQSLPPIHCQVTTTDILHLWFYSEMWLDKTIQIPVEIPKLMVCVRHCAKHITSFCWIEPLTDDDIVTASAMPQTNNIYGYLVDNKMEKIKIWVCVCVKQEKNGGTASWEKFSDAELRFSFHYSCGGFWVKITGCIWFSKLMKYM